MRISSPRQLKDRINTMAKENKLMANTVLVRRNFLAASSLYQVLYRKCGSRENFRELFRKFPK